MCTTTQVSGSRGRKQSTQVLESEKTESESYSTPTSCVVWKTDLILPGLSSSPVKETVITTLLQVVRNLSVMRET